MTFLLNRNCFLRRRETELQGRNKRPGKSRLFKPVAGTKNSPCTVSGNTIPNKMSTKPKVVKHLVALNLSKLTVPQIIANTKLYVQNMTGNTNFPTPSPALSTVSTQLAKLEASYTVSQTRVKGSVATMRADQKALVILLKALASYVEQVANETPDTAEATIASSGMPLKKPRPHVNKTFSVTLSKDPDTVVLNTKAVKDSSYVYQVTTDATNANSWTNVIISNTAKYTKNGFSSGTRYYFRVAVITKNVQGPWSPVLSVIVP